MDIDLFGNHSLGSIKPEKFKKLWMLIASKIFWVISLFATADDYTVQFLSLAAFLVQK